MSLLDCLLCPPTRPIATTPGTSRSREGDLAWLGWHTIPTLLHLELAATALPRHEKRQTGVKESSDALYPFTFSHFRFLNLILLLNTEN